VKRSRADCAATLKRCSRWLAEDLDLDSIDAVDLVVKLQEMTGRKLKVDEFRSVRTVGDVIDRVHAVLAE
jgi:acyl carrier protein